VILIASDAFQQTCQQDLRANERARLSTPVLAIGRRPIPRLAQSDHCSPKAKVTRSNRVGRTGQDENTNWLVTIVRRECAA